MKRTLLFVSFLLLNILTYAQSGREVKGIVQDTTGAPVFSATVRLIPESAGTGDTLTTRSDVDGNFTFRNVSKSNFTVSVSSLGYTTTVRAFNFPAGTSPIALPVLKLSAGSRILDEVVVDGTPPVTVKVDTVEYSVANLKLKADATVEDALKRVDGAEVDKDGNVTAKGKAVTKIKVDGKEIFGGDLKTITKNLPADAIDKIQLVDDYGDQAAFTGVKDGDPETIINITTRPGRNNGYITNATIGGGTQERYQVSAFATQFKGDRNLGINANLNNNGAWVGGGNFGGRGGMMGGGFQPGGGGGDGITSIGSLALNYNNKFGEKLRLSSSYYFNNEDRLTIRDVYRQNANRLGTVYSDEYSNGNNITNNHSFFGRLEYNINKSNLIVFTPFVSLRKSRSENTSSVFQTGVIRQDQTNAANTESWTPNFNGNILYNHLFAKPGRNYSINLGFRNNSLDSDQGNDIHIVYYDPTGNTLQDSLNYRLNETRNRTFSGNSRLVYNEPLSETGRIQLSYDVNYNNYDNSRISSLQNLAGILQPVDSLSNIFQYSFLSQRVGVNYNYRSKNNELSIGLTANPTSLSGQSKTLGTDVSRTNFFLAPILRYQYRYGRTMSVNVNYFGNAAEPQFSQIQPVRDLSNPQRPVVGNPNLNSSFSHMLNAGYRNENPDTRTSLSFDVQANMIRNQIVQNIVLIPDLYGALKQEVRFTNADGYYMVFGGYNWRKSFADRQFVFFLRGDTRFTRAVSLADNIKNYSLRNNISQRLGLEINPGDWMEFRSTMLYSRTTTNYTLETNTDTKLHTYAIDVDGRFLFLPSKTLVLGFNGGKTFNNGYTGGLNTNPLVVNTYLEKQFMNKRAYVRLQAFDLFRQANNITRTVVENGFTDVQTNRLTQYFMLSLNMRITKLAGGRPNQGDRPGNFQRPEGGFPRGEGGFNRGGGGGAPQGPRGNF